MLNEEERAAFSQRLKQVLVQAHIDPSPAALTRLFNMRTKGKTVTVHAVRKWLLGEAIPTQEKLRTLSAVLRVTPEWLRFGGETTLPPAEERPLSLHEYEWLELFRRLTKQQQSLLVQLIDSLISTGRK